MQTFTFVVDWSGDLGFFYSPVIVASGETEWEARERANEYGTEVFAKELPEHGITDLFEENGYVVAVFEGDVTDRLIGDHSVLDARTKLALIHL